MQCELTVTRKIHVGVIGCGYWGSNYLRVFNELGGSALTACADTDESRLSLAKERYPWIRTTGEYSEILGDPAIDAVCISTPASSHYSLVKESLLSEKDVLVEKPFTLSTDQASELVALAKQTQKILMVGHVFVYHPAVRQLKEYLQAGLLGKLVYMHSQRTGLGPIRNDVNVMWDLAPHDLSIYLYLLGSLPSKVCSFGHAYVTKQDVAFIVLTFPGNVMASVHLSWVDPYKTRQMTVVGSNKTAVFDDIQVMEKLRIYDKGISYQREFATFGEFQLMLRDGDIVTPSLSSLEPLKQMSRHFLNCVVERSTPETDGINGLNVVRILESAQKSLESDGIRQDLAHAPASSCQP
jgi:predicted dehydrogenase